MSCRLTSCVFLLLLSFNICAQDNRFTLGLYVVVDDISVAKQFYQSLFQTEPFIDNGPFVGFRVNNGLFALYAKEVYSHPLVQGNNVVPYIQVEDIEAEFTRVNELITKKIGRDSIVTEGPISLFMFTDPSGNLIEFFALTTPHR